MWVARLAYSEFINSNIFKSRLLKLGMYGTSITAWVPGPWELAIIGLILAGFVAIWILSKRIG
jgi:hypothetical protein